MPLFTNKLNPGVKEFEKGLLKFGLVALFFVFGLFGVFSNVFGADIVFEDDFEDYDLGTLDGQGGWSGDDTQIEVQNTIVREGVKAIIVPHRSPPGYPILGKFGTSTCIGSIGFWFYVDDPSVSDNYLYFVLHATTTGNTVAYIKIDPRPSSRGVYLRGSSEVNLGTFADNTQYPVDMEWNCTNNQVRARFNNGEWSSWYGPFSGAYEEVNRIKFQHNPRSTNFADFYIDWIAETSEIPGCSLEYCDLCETFDECRDVGCYWHYDLYENYFYCAEYPTGECGVGPHWVKCQPCLSQETCEAVEDCYWQYGYCRFSFGECAGGLQCQFCAYQETCEAQGCYWYNNFCWISEPATTTSWFDYYTEYGDYPTSSAFTNKMASTTGIIFGSINSFLSGFVEAFDSQEALAYGQGFGSAIPKARGYLAIFNEFFGELPVAQIFLFLISFLLAVGLFRLIRNLITLFKFW